MALERCFSEIRNLAESTSEIQQMVKMHWAATNLPSMKSPDYEQLMRIETRIVSLSRATQETLTMMNSRLASLEASSMYVESKLTASTTETPDHVDWWTYFALLLVIWLAIVTVGMLCLHFANFRYHHLTVS